jgi:predicted  nucleic acid-binding Zn-ribbon protein
VNPQWHDEFVALCALFPSGELTEEEWALLQVHLAYCDSCRVAFDQYQQVTSEVIPVMAASGAAEWDNRSRPASFSVEAAEQRLIGRLDIMPVEAISARSRRYPWRVAAGALAACIALAAVAALHRYHSNAGTQTPPNTNPVAKVESQKPVASQPSDQTILRPELEHTQLKVAELERQVNEAQVTLQQSNASVTRLQQQIEAETAERKKTSEERDQLSQQLVAAQTEVQSLRDKTAATSTATAQQGARTTSLEARLRDANAALEEKDRLLALDKEFLAHDREIRDLIGARDLYIADIYDVAQSGKTNKPFGRLFYTKDKSLVFYGYDLDKQSGLKQSVAFQAWGSGDDKQDVSLGLFYQDDTHKRWVLRFNDTKTLAHLNKVFVTAEPQGGSAKPTGKPLLLAYLQMQPNHP